MSIAGGMDRAVARAVAAGCEALQVFCKSSNQWRAKPLEEGEIAAFREAVARAGLAPVVAHTSYLINLGTPDDALWERSTEALLVELDRCEALGIAYLVLHPGSHVGSGEQAGIARIAAALDRVHRARPGACAMILLENTAGQGSNLGWRFEQLRDLVARVREPERLGVCLDTAHAFAAGYDLGTADGWNATWDAVDELLGWSRVRAVHVNDSKKPLGSRVDRHEQIGLGEIGPGAFLRLMNDARFDGLVACLETEKTEGGFEDEQNLAVLRRLIGRKRPPARAVIERWRDEARAAALGRADRAGAAAARARRTGRARR